MNQGQQPVWGVGRLRLSFLGFAEPRLDKCNDLRLFLFPQNLARIFAERAKHRVMTEPGHGFCIRKTHCAETRTAWCETTCGIYTHEVYYEDNKEDGLQEAPSYRKEQSDR